MLLLIAIARRKYSTCSRQPAVTVIVAARNEANHILNCLHSIANCRYPPSKLEIIIVNDRSTDATATLMKQFIQNHPSFKYLEIHVSHPHLSGKAGALSAAIAQSTGEIIVITDADCTVPANWLLETVRYFTENVGIVAGFTVIQSTERRFSLFEKIQALDWLYLLTVAAAAAAIDLPVSCVGNNFAFRRKAYDEVGGYEGVGFSLTEDFALLSTINRCTSWQIVFPLNRAGMVTSQPVKNISAFFRQRIRWATGGFQVRLFGKMLIILGTLTHLTVLVCFACCPMLISLTALALIMLSDLSLVTYASNKLHLKKLLRYYPFFKIFSCSYLLITPLLTLIKREITWKDIAYPLSKKGKA